MPLTIHELFTRAEPLEFPLVVFAGSRHLVGRRQWEAARDGQVVLAPKDLEEIGFGLESEAAVQGRSRRGESVIGAAFRAGLDPDTPDPTEALTERVLGDAADAAAYRATTDGKLDRVIELLEQLAAKAETR